MIGFEDQNKLFCSSDDSDVTKKFVTLGNKLIVNALRRKVTISQKTMEIKNRQSHVNEIGEKYSI
jgi:hypothetical protein